MRRLLLAALLLVLAVPSVAAGQSEQGSRLDVIDISGPLDRQAITFISDTIQQVADEGSQAVIIEISSPGVVADAAHFEALRALIASPPLPAAMWVGPAPAVAYGGVLDLLAASQIPAAAPGAHIGLAEPTLVADRTDDTTRLPVALSESILTVSGPVEGLVEELSPAISQLIQDMDGTIVDLSDGPHTLSTLVPGPDGTVQPVPVVFHKPGFWSRFLRLAVTPEAAFLFLAAGLAIAAFEFYAIGPGIAAAMAAISLFLASYGVWALPVRWWAMALTLVAWWALTYAYQRGGAAVLTGVGAVLMLVGGLWYVDGAPQLQMNPVVTLVIVAVVVLFYTVAMPTVARSRFSTRTIGRDHLVGSQGVALVDFDPDGEVEVAGARWKASAHREAGIERGDPVRIAEVDGLVLEVEAVEASTDKA